MSESNDQQNHSVEWKNWFSNQCCQATRIERPSSEPAVQDAVHRAVKQGLTIRPLGSGHSLTAVVPTDGVLLHPAPIGEVTVDYKTMTACIPAGHTIQSVADTLYDQGVSMCNLGELKQATLIGAVSTGVHGTGIGLQCLAASVCGLRIVTANGSVIEINENDSQLLKAARVSLGMLGVITQISVHVLPAYNLKEHSFFCSADELVERWDELVHGNRHFSFFYLPHIQAVPKHASVVPQIMTSLGACDGTLALEMPNTQDTCLVTVRDKFDQQTSMTELGPGERYGRMDRILNYEFDSPYREIEFAIPYETSPEVFIEMRNRVRTYYPDYDQPMLVRFAAQDDAMLSWFNTGPKAIFSVVEDANAPYEGILADCESFFDEKGGLPHWGKEHKLTKARLERLQPQYRDFQEIRRQFDPAGTFLNEHLGKLFL